MGKRAYEWDSDLLTASRVGALRAVNRSYMRPRTGQAMRWLGCLEVVAAWVLGAGAGGARDCRMWLRILSMTAGSVISAITLRVPPHNGQTVTSNSNARFSRSAQVSREG